VTKAGIMLVVVAATKARFARHLLEQVALPAAQCTPVVARVQATVPATVVATCLAQWPVAARQQQRATSHSLAPR